MKAIHTNLVFQCTRDIVILVPIWARLYGCETTHLNFKSILPMPIGGGGMGWGGGWVGWVRGGGFWPPGLSPPPLTLDPPLMSLSYKRQASIGRPFSSILPMPIGGGGVGWGGVGDGWGGLGVGGSDPQDSPPPLTLDPPLMSLSYKRQASIGRPFSFFKPTCKTPLTTRAPHLSICPAYGM